MKDKKAKITIEFQAERDEDLRNALLTICYALNRSTIMCKVTATFDISPDKYNPYVKS